MALPNAGLPHSAEGHGLGAEVGKGVAESEGSRGGLGGEPLFDLGVEAEHVGGQQLLALADSTQRDWNYGSVRTIDWR